MPVCLCDLFLYIVSSLSLAHGGFNSQESLSGMKSLALEVSRPLKKGPFLNEGCSCLTWIVKLDLRLALQAAERLLLQLVLGDAFLPCPQQWLYIEWNIYLGESIFTRASGIKKVGLGNGNSWSWVEKLLKVRSQPWTCWGWNFPGYSFLQWDIKAPT